MSDTADRLILNLLSNYCDRVDRFDIEGVVGLFAEDGEYDFGFGRVYTGHDALRTLFSRLAAYRATSHHISNVHLEGSGAEASSRCALYAYHVRPDGSEVHVWGQYRDLLRVVDGRWVIARRALRVAHEKGTRPEDGRRTLYEPLPRIAEAI